MSEPYLKIHTVLDNKIFEVPYNSSTTAEDVCIHICKQFGILTIARHLFALRVTGKNIFLKPSAAFTEKQTYFDFRIRFKVSSVAKLRKIDEKAYDYYFHQARNDVLENKIPDIVCEKYRRELVGLGITDMYRVMLEKDIPRETVENEYKKYIPKEVLKRHSFFIKKPIHDTLGKLQKSVHDARYVKAEYLKQLDIIAPEYLSETYKIYIDEDEAICCAYIKVSPYHPSEPGIKYCLETKKEKWHQVCTIEELGFISIRDDDGTVEISRKNGIPFYLKFSNVQTMFSFISLLDGYYRLTCKWTFNICKDVTTPSLQKLYAMKCHGPVGGEFSYAKLEEKRANRAGCFIIRESAVKYNDYYIDVCTKDSLKPKTFKLEKITNDEFIFNDDLTRYKSIQQLIAAYSDPNGAIYLQECLPPSEYDISPLLLCQNDNVLGESVTDSSALNNVIPSAPMCINCKNLQVFKDRKCLKWNKDRNKVKEKGEYVSYETFSKTRFPEGKVSKAKKYCRNPNGDIGGPWCFVENEDTDEIEREYCDIPFCHVSDCEVFTKSTPNYTHYTDFNNTLTNFSFGIKLWDSDSYLNASATLLLSVLALPATGKEIEDLGIGIEVYLSNKLSALTFGNKDKPEFEETEGILKSTGFTMFTLSWGAPFISLSYENQIKPIFLAEYRIKNNLMGYKKNQFNFYSAKGVNVQWSFPFCMEDFECDVQTTTSSQFQQFWPLSSTDVGQELQFYLRAFHSVYLLFVPTPTVDYPNIKFILQRDNQMSRITASIKEDSNTIIKELPLPDILSYWNWHEFSITFFADTMQFYWTKSVGSHLIFEIKHEMFRIVRWFSPSSDTIAHWTFFCIPPEPSKPPSALLPECALNQEEENYKGTQDVTSIGFPCLPWSATNVLPSIVEENFQNKTYLLEAWNYCRDPVDEGKGTYCYIFNKNKQIEKKYCRIRKCKSEECRMAGTGNDYVGALSVTRSNRTCDYWFDNATAHVTEDEYSNETLYADRSLDDVKNLCRNPSRDFGGSWCYTTDKNVSKDLCNVRDCDRPEENIIIVDNALKGRKVYILPQWKISGFEFGLKQWNPDLSDGVQFNIYSQQENDQFDLIVGAKGNEKVLLYHKKQLKKEKTFVHLISSGKWTDFWLLMRQGEISLGFKGVPDSFFEYKSDEIFDPIFLSYGTLESNPVGFFLKNDECQTENLTTDSFTKIMPVGLWSFEEKAMHLNFSLQIRGTGSVTIPLFNLISLPPHILQIDSFKREISLIFEDEVLEKKILIDDILLYSNWTSFSISFNENHLNVSKNNELVFTYHSEKPLLFYWFSVGVMGGSLIWNANCEPLDIDGPPRDGGWSAWSPWHCTVKCGGGEGFRIRNCTNPKPNIKGKLCPGSYKSTGICNDFLCGDVSPNTLEKIRENLQTHQFSFVVNEGRSVVLENDEDMLKIVKTESPDSYYEWTHNGIFLQPEQNKIIFEGDKLIIRNINVEDSGIYVCMLYRINKQKVVLRVISLAVVSEDYTVKTRATRTFTILCRSVVLGYIYSDLSLKLYLNDKIYKDYGTIMLAAVNSEHLDNLNMSHTGDWKCVVEQKDLKLSWVTNYIRLEVKKAPNFYTNLMEDEFTSPIFGWLETEENVFYALIFIVCFVIALCALFLFLYFKYCTLKSRWN